MLTDVRRSSAVVDHLNLNYSTFVTIAETSRFVIFVRGAKQPKMDFEVCKPARSHSAGALTLQRGMLFKGAAVQATLCACSEPTYNCG